MKTINCIAILIVGLLFLSCSDSNLEESLEDIYVTIPDIKFEEELIALGIDSDNTVNQQILKTDAESIENLSIGGKSIEDLTGIEGFINLKRLYANNNDLESIDLSGNIQLDTISLVSNKLTSVKGLSKVKNLKWLNLSFNFFQEFMLDNLSIKTLLISNNDLVSFDASKAPNLRNVNLTLNKIDALDFSTNLLLQNLFFSSNKVGLINLDNNVNLKYVYCSRNLLTDFDASKLDKLIELRVDKNPNLNCIKISSGQSIPTINLSSYQQTNVNCN